MTIALDNGSAAVTLINDCNI